MTSDMYNLSAKAIGENLSLERIIYEYIVVASDGANISVYKYKKENIKRPLTVASRILRERHPLALFVVQRILLKGGIEQKEAYEVRIVSKKKRRHKLEMSPISLSSIPTPEHTVNNIKEIPVPPNLENR